MKNCPNCSAVVRQDATKCSVCGADLSLEFAATLPKPQTFRNKDQIRPQPVQNKSLSLSTDSQNVECFVVGTILANRSRIVGAFVWQRGKTLRASLVPFASMQINQLTANGNIVNAALSPDGKYFVYALAESAGQSLWVQQVSAARPVQIAPPAKVSYWGLTITPDGNHVYCSVFEANKANTQLLRIPLLGGLGEKISITSAPDSALTFSPDGSRIAWTALHGDKTKLITAKADGSDEKPMAERKYPSSFSYEGASVSWSPDGAIIAVAARDVDQNGEFMSVVPVDAASGEEKPLTLHRWAIVNHLVWLRDQSGLLVVAKESLDYPAQIWLLPYPEGAARQLTNDLNSYEWLSVTNDSAAFLSVQRISVTRLLATSENQSIEAAPTIIQQTGSYDEISWTPAGQIVYLSFASGETNLWMMNADGSNQRQLTTGMQACKGLAVSPDNRFIVFSAYRAGKQNIWRVDTDGNNLKQLTKGDGEGFPTISADGNWVVYQQGVTGKVSLQKIPAAGGDSVRLTEMRGIRPQFSPDGKSVAFFFMDKSAESEPQWCIGIVSAENGQLQKKLPLAPTIVERFLRWTPDGKSIAYISSEGDTSNIVLHALDEASSTRSLTAFQSGAAMIQAFAWSRDGKHLALTRESNIRDVVLVRNLGKALP